MARAKAAALRLEDVYLSDFMGDSGTPLQWAVAWEAVEEKEYAQGCARLACYIALSSGLPYASIVTAVVAIATQTTWQQ